MKALMVRKPGWGVDFGKAVNHLSEKIKCVKSTAKMPLFDPECEFFINWGYPDRVFDHNLITLNKREAISLASNKSKFRKKCMEEDEDIVPRTWMNGLDDIVYPVIVRPSRHKQGENLYLCNNNMELNNATYLCGQGYYISEYIPKVAEYRVYIVDGRVFAVNQKIPGNPEAVAWNHAGDGAEFVNVRWDNWPLAACDVACRAFNLSGLDFGGVDVMVDDDGRAYVLEINSAISLPFLEDGEEIVDCISYNQKAMIKCLEWRVDGKDAAYEYNGRREFSYHQYIHAAMKDKGDA